MNEFYSDCQNSIRGKWGENYSLGEMGGGGLDVKTIAWMFSYFSFTIFKNPGTSNYILTCDTSVDSPLKMQ